MSYLKQAKGLANELAGLTKKLPSKITRRQLLIGSGVVTAGIAGTGSYHVFRRSPPPAQCRMILFSGMGPHNVVRMSKWMERDWPNTKIEYLDGVTTGLGAIPSMRTGDVDIAMIGSVPTALAIVKGYDYPCFYSLMIHGRSEALVLRKGLINITDADSQKIEKLNQASLWSPKASTAEFMLSKYLELQGATKAEIKNGDPNEILEAWNNDVIDGAYLWGNALLEMLSDNGEMAIYSGSPEFANQGYLTADICLVRRGFYLEHPDFVRDYASKLDQGVSLLRSNVGAAARLIGGPDAKENEIKLLKISSSGNKYQKLREQQKDSKILGKDALLGKLFQEAGQFLQDQGHFSGPMPTASEYYNAVLRI